MSSVVLLFSLSLTDAWVKKMRPFVGAHTQCSIYYFKPREKYAFFFGEIQATPAGSHSKLKMHAILVQLRRL